jgi:hypothetical protein
MSEDRMKDRQRLLDTAAEAVLYQRNKTYGEPDEDFARIAATLNALGYRGPDGRALRGHDVSVIMISLKLSRLTWMETHEDSWVDIAGYAACGMETANLQSARDLKESLPDRISQLTDDQMGYTTDLPAGAQLVANPQEQSCSDDCAAGHTYVGPCVLRRNRKIADAIRREAGGVY